MSARSLVRQFAANRREFILGAGSLAVVPWLDNLALGGVATKPSFQENPFQLGVASGDPLPDGFVLWTRLAPEPIEPAAGMSPDLVEVTWELAQDDQFNKIVRRGKQLSTPQLGHTIHAEIHGLQPDQWYWFRFHCGDATSPVGRARTTPRPQAEKDELRFAFASCQHFEHGYYTAYEHMAQEDLDLILFLGDYIYEYGPADNQPRRHVGQELQTLEDYRTRLSLYRTDPHLQSAHARCPWLVVWDDHEFDNNYADETSEENGIDRDAFLLRRANAYQAFYEMMPLRKRSIPRGPDMQLYRRHTFGRLANFEMLDTRQYRNDQPNGDGLKPLKPEDVAPRQSLLGAKQKHWLMRDLLASQSQWNILGQQVMMGDVDFVGGDDEAFSMDQWSGYHPERDQILRFLHDRQIPNPVVLTGDIHSNWVNNLRTEFRNPKSPLVATEFVTTSISSGGDGSDMTDRAEQFKSENACVQYFDAQRGYVRCTVTPDAWIADYQQVEYVEKPGAPLITKASFVVEAGQPGAKTK